jgi:hypothetical protein
VTVFGPKEDRLALTRPDGSVEVRDLRSGELLVPLIEGLHGAASVVAASEDVQAFLAAPCNRGGCVI